MNFRHIICLAAIFGAALSAVVASGGQWTKGMDDDAGKAAATSRTEDESVHRNYALIRVTWL